MELNDGMKWLATKCVNCKFCEGKFCKKYRGDRIDLPINLMECPGFEEETIEENK